MPRFSRALGAALTVLASLAGCASVPRAQGLADIHALVEQRNGSAPDWNAAPTADADQATLASLLAQPLTLASASEIALLRNPRLQMEFARLGIAQADVIEASRISNPSFSLAVLSPDRASEKTRIDAGLGTGLAELLLLPARQRLARGEYARAKETIAAAVLNLLCDVRGAWFGYLGAEQVSQLRATVAEVAATAAQLADRFHAAGNIAALEWQLQQAAATESRIAASRARAEATRARAALNELLGLDSVHAHWLTHASLPLPSGNEDAVDTLLAIAQQQRLDLLAARDEETLLEQALATTRRYRWLGKVDVGVSSERDHDGTRLLGPSLSLQLPIFDQGQAAIARGEAQLAQARARRVALEREIESAVRLGVERVASAAAIAEDYRRALIPQRDAAVARTEEKTNYALAGVFELLLSRQQQVDAYQGYVEAVRDYWLARTELTRAVGARLPSDSATSDTLIDSALPGLLPTDDPHAGATP